MKSFDDHLDKMELKGIVVMSPQKFTLWRDVEHIKYAYEMNTNLYFSVYIQSFFHHIFF